MPGPYDDEDASDYTGGAGSGAEEESAAGSEEVPEPTKLKITLKNTRGGAKGRPRGTGRPRGRPRTSGLTITVRRKPTDIVDDAASDTPAGSEPPQDATPSNSGAKPYVIVGQQTYYISRDNLETQEDPIGNTKIDQDGNLLGGRQFKANTFTIPGREYPTLKYMLAIDCARASGYRDSLYYFRRNPMMLKLNLSQAEKEYLIQEGKLHTNLRHRSVTMVTARSAFKQHGAKIVKDGKWVVDDYFEEAAKAEAAAKGAKPGDLVLEPTETMGYASTTAADIIVKGVKESRTGIYKPGGPTTFFGNDGVGPFRGEMSSTKKAMLAREGLTEENWMAACAYSVWECNEEVRRSREERITVGAGVEEIKSVFGGNGHWYDIVYGPAPPVEVKEEAPMEVEEGNEEDEITKAGARRAAAYAAALESTKPRAVYEVHTGQLHYPLITQPTKCRWEPVPGHEHMHILGGTAKVGTGAWGLAWIDYVMKDEGHFAAEEARVANLLQQVQEAERDGPAPLILEKS